MFGLVGTENLGRSQGVGEVLEGFYHMGKNAKSWWFQDMKIPNFMEFLFKRKRLNSKNKFEREPSEKKFQRIKHQSLKKIKSLPKQRKFFKRKDFMKKINGLFSKTTKFLLKTKVKILECHR